MPRRILDSHVHLWPASAANAGNHAWMELVPSLAKRHDLGDYRKATRDASDFAAVPSVIYVETDRRYTYDSTLPLEQWAAGPLEEIKFLRSIIEGNARDASILSGIVLWAPVDHGVEVFHEWLKLAAGTAGQRTWSRVKGFRFLLQAITSRLELENLVLSPDFIAIMKSLGTLGFTFDVGIDHHHGGAWQLEVWDEAMNLVLRDQTQPTVFILNHLCKPDLTSFHEAEVSVWQKWLRSYARHPSVYMKLSGAFSEMSEGTVDSLPTEQFVEWIRPWTDAVLDIFGSERMMFGSDWPVCNIRGPADDDSWALWMDIADTICKRRDLKQSEQHRIFFGTAVEAYHLNTP